MSDKKKDRVQMSGMWHLKKRTVILLHIIAWLLFFSIPLLLHPPISFNQSVSDGHRAITTAFRAPPRFEIHQLIADLLLVGIFYLNAYVLLPAFIQKRRIFRSLFFQLILFLSFCLVNYFLFSLIADRNDFYFSARPFIEGHRELNHFSFPPHGGSFHKAPGLNISPASHHLIPLLFKNTFSYFLIIVSSIAYCMIIDRIKSDRLAKEKETENLKTELQLLRSQINPHFMFNVLNNMVSLARKKSELLEPSLIKLSSLMRYMYYDSKEGRVSLSKEVAYIKSYIEIQEQRFQGSLEVNANLLLPDNNYYIEPMLLIPFVENAFKHGVVLVDDAKINIDLNIINGILYFRVNNKFSADKNEIKDKTPGIGLKNVKKRLALLYSDCYHLDIRTEDNWHTVSLQLNLK